MYNFGGIYNKNNIDLQKYKNSRKFNENVQYIQTENVKVQGNQINDENHNKENIYVNNHYNYRRNYENQLKCNTQKLSRILGNNFEIQNELGSP